MRFLLLIASYIARPLELIKIVSRLPEFYRKHRHVKAGKSVVFSALISPLVLLAMVLVLFVIGALGVDIVRYGELIFFGFVFAIAAIVIFFKMSSR